MAHYPRSFKAKAKVKLCGEVGVSRAWGKKRKMLGLQAALAKYIADGLDKDGRAQALLKRVAICLELQDKKQPKNRK